MNGFDVEASNPFMNGFLQGVGIMVVFVSDSEIIVLENISEIREYSDRDLSKYIRYEVFGNLVIDKSLEISFSGKDLIYGEEPVFS